MLAFLCMLLIACTSAFQKSPLQTRSFVRTSLSMMSAGFYDLVEKDAKGADVKFDKFKGKVVYGVNVASKCGYTKTGYELLAKIAKMPNVEVAIFPCNQVTERPRTTNTAPAPCA
jgi:glutathione peroxidase-family protein